ncbi:flavodoxin family protein [Heliobacterium undosum]|uniref:Flavodoxin family protein n=1 Tax=Heliomicrobium undosum TaxID=121734 RepID=A0A845L907_9FIRM|nr:flavodoxin family protein [Heliomicrobium undosum]MZP31110.1 flavodoxin family protein [Heliomicrobium undosum]
MKKVILISGSPRQKGNTMQVLQACAEAIQASGMETEIVSLAGKNIQSCVACGQCKSGKCALNDGLNEIIDKIRDAQGLVVGAPVYFGTARGDLMSAVQRISMVSMASDRFLSWKVGGPIAVGRRGGLTSTLQEMLMFYFISEMIVAGSTYWNIVFGRNPGEAMNDEEGLRTVRRFGENVAKLIEKIHTY